MSFADSFKIKAKSFKSGNADNSSKPVKYRNLVLEGGGILGISHIGAIEELHKLGILSGIKNYAGSSAGAIIAGALACGASFNFLMEELPNTNFASFLDYGSKIRAIWNLYYYNGAAPGDAFMNWYGSLIEKLTGGKEITLGQIHEKYGGRLVITGTSLNHRRIIYFDYRTHPDLPLRLAVRISMSIPGLFIPVKYNNDVFVDGGVLDNYPIRCFHRETRTSDRVNPKTLGIMLMTADEKHDKYPEVVGLSTFISAVYGCYKFQTQKTYIDPQDWDRTIKVPCGVVSSYDFNIDDKTKQELITAGRQAVIDYFGKNDMMDQQQYIAKGVIDTGHRESDDSARECI